MGLFGCFKDPDASRNRSKRAAGHLDKAQDNQLRPNRIVPDPRVKDSNSPTPTTYGRGALPPPVAADPVSVETTIVGDDYEPEPWSVGAVRRRTSMLPERKSPVVARANAMSPNREFQAQEDPGFLLDVNAYWMSQGGPVRAIDLLNLPSIDIKQLRAKGSGVAEGDEAEAVTVEAYTGLNRPR